MIREIYTGRYPSSGLTGLFGDSKDLLVTSAIKSVTSFEGKPRAVNFLMKKISRGSHLTRSRASEQGTPFIFYSPALLEKSLTMDLSMVFDSFPKEVFEKIGDVLTAAAGIPLFLPQSTYLMAAGMLIKIAGGAGESMFDGKPVFESSSALDIYWPGSPPLPPGFALITSDDVDTVDPAFRNTYQVNAQGKVVDSAGTEYSGDIPYIVISMDGTLQEELASFSPTAASAAVLSRFFGIRQGQEQPLDTLIDAMKLYNDYHFRLKVDRLDRQIEASPPGEARDELKRKRDALAGNILEELLKPKS
jgi:hypothetical protein